MMELDEDTQSNEWSSWMKNVNHVIKRKHWLRPNLSSMAALHAGIAEGIVTHLINGINKCNPHAKSNFCSAAVMVV